MKKNQLRDVIYIGLSICIILFMFIMTWFYLSNRTVTNNESPVVHKSVDNNDSSIVTSSSSTVSSSATNDVNEAQSDDTSISSETISSSNTEITVENTTGSEQYMSEFRFLYMAVGGDTLYTVSELTGVDVAIIADVNGLSQDVILVKDQKIYVP